MPRRTTITTEELLSTARQVFLDQGFSVPTSSIARAAGISEGSIFKRFPTKVALFEAAMKTNHLSLSSELTGLAELATARERLEAMGDLLVSFFRQVLPASLMLMANSNLNPIELMQDSPDPLPLRLLNEVTSFLEEEQSKGTIHCVHCKTTATILIGSLRGFVFLEIMQKTKHSPETTQDFVRGVVETIWTGIGT